MRVATIALAFIALTTVCFHASGQDSAKSQDYLAQASDAYGAGDLDRTIELLKLSIASDNKNWQSFYVLGMIYYDREDYQNARLILGDLQMRGGRTAFPRPDLYYEVALSLGMAYASGGDLKSAKPLLDEVIKLQNEEKFDLVIYSEMYMHLGQYDKAIEYSNNYIEYVKPQTSKGVYSQALYGRLQVMYLVLGVSHEALGDTTKAIDDYKSVIGLTFGHPNATKVGAKAAKRLENLTGRKWDE